MIEHSMLLIDTGFSIIPRTQEPSQGAGHTLPVNSGKLLVSRRRSNASRHLFWYTNSLNSGILFPRGHPEFSYNLLTREIRDKTENLDTSLCKRFRITKKKRKPIVNSQTLWQFLPDGRREYHSPCSEQIVSLEVDWAWILP